MKNKLQSLALLHFLLAITTALYLLYSGLGSSAPIGCSEGQGCGLVLNSSWSKFLGIPVIALGVLMYSTWIVCNLLSGRNTFALSMGKMLSYLVLLGALWFGIIQLFILKAFCPWCCVVHTLASIGAVLWLFKIRGSSFEYRYIGFWSALGCVLIFSGTQVLFPSKVPGYSAKKIMQVELDQNSADLRLYDGALTVDRGLLPVVIASENAEEKSAICILLSDYTCPHCQIFLHELVKNTDLLSKHATVYYLPAYHNNKAREINRLMLIVQKADFGVYTELLDALISGSVSLEYNALKKLADQKLQGHYDLYFKAHMEWSEKLLKMGIRLMELNQEHAQASVFPQIIVGGQLLEGMITVPELFEQIEASSEVNYTSDLIPPVGKQNKGSSLVFKESSIDLGRITKNDSGSGVIQIRNDSENDIEITKIGRTCGCIQLDLDARVVPSHDVLTIPFEFQTQKFLGEVTHSILIYEKGVRRPVAIPVSADVWLPVRIFPLKNSFGRVAVGSSSEIRTIPIINSENQAVNLTVKRCDNPAVDAKLTIIRPGRHYELNVTIPEMPSHPITAKVVLATDHPDCPEIIVPVSAMNADAVETFPSEIDDRRLTSSRELRIAVRCNDYIRKKNFLIESASYVGEQEVKVSYQMDKNPGSGRIVLTLGQGFDFKQAEKKGELIKIRTNNTNAAKIDVPFKETKHK